MNLKHQHITDKILKCFFDIYNELGRGFLEPVYENALVIALSDLGMDVKTQQPIPVYFRGRNVGDFRADIIVENKVILELKAAKAIDPKHIAQLMNYLKATEIKVGLLLNFGEIPDFKRLVYDNYRK